VSAARHFGDFQHRFREKRIFRKTSIASRLLAGAKRLHFLGLARRQSGTVGGFVDTNRAGTDPISFWIASWFRFHLHQQFATAPHRAVFDPLRHLRQRVVLHLLGVPRSYFLTA
jgi:hypothetical protein